eukprot:CAMPEP_0204907520 /NCGR_PEP_ID=MMETSP1397-20131031/6651_1 /ASSEMBLY_ACC=CAM_ASM_000891 /TAXON_ID=49980 /ORGANISM="Climacostomum Climacostomum virens, Strain Stock W-24" /LENGTH=72 /DNA_ID=CAMNT_0052076701 /DNA_START=593 /DNA_END=808 /DNA_ORIENTATION=-
MQVSPSSEDPAAVAKDQALFLFRSHFIELDPRLFLGREELHELLSVAEALGVDFGLESLAVHSPVFELGASE